MEKKERDYILKFRAVLEQEDVRKMHVGFKDFPDGSCGDASELLGYLLKGAGFGEYNLVSGENQRGSTHAWLENETYLIDITSDHFQKSNGEFIIKPKDRKRTSHLGFRVTGSRAIDPKNIFIHFFMALQAVESRMKL